MLSRILTLPFYLVDELIVFPMYKRRLAWYVASLCEENARILDVGCNDGKVARMIKKHKPSVSFTGVDVQAHRPAQIERRLYDGRRLPFPDNSFDIVMALDVLHHSKDALALLGEMKRVTKRHIIIKDHRKYGFFSNLLLSFTDYCANAPYGIKCRFRYYSMKEWNRLFSKLKLKLLGSLLRPNLGFLVIKRQNPIFKLEKQEGSNASRQGYYQSFSRKEFKGL